MDFFSFFSFFISKRKKIDWKFQFRQPQHFLKKFLNFISLVLIIIFDIHNPSGSKLLMILRLSLSHIHQYKFKRCFKGTLNPSCAYIQSITYFSFHCNDFHSQRQTLFQNIKKTYEQILSESETQITQIFSAATVTIIQYW